MRRPVVGQRPPRHAQRRPRIRCHLRDLPTVYEIGKEAGQSEMVNLLADLVRETARRAYAAGAAGEPQPIPGVEP